MPKLLGPCRWKDNLFTKCPAHTKETVNTHFLLPFNFFLSFVLSSPLLTPCSVASLYLHPLLRISGIGTVFHWLPALMCLGVSYVNLFIIFTLSLRGGGRSSEMRTRAWHALSGSTCLDMSHKGPWKESFPSTKKGNIWQEEGPKASHKTLKLPPCSVGYIHYSNPVLGKQNGGPS